MRKVGSEFRILYLICIEVATRCAKLAKLFTGFSATAPGAGIGMGIAKVQA